MSQKHFSDGSEVDVFGWPVAGTSILTAAGFSGTAPTTTARFMILGFMVMITIPALSGTSNDTVFTMTGLDPALWPAVARSSGCVFVVDKGEPVIGTVVLEPSGVLSVYAGPVGSPFKNNGNKGFDLLQLSFLR